MRARVLSWRGDWRAATAAWAELTTAYPEHPGVLSGAAAHSLAKSDRRQAELLYRAALEVDPSNVEAQDGLSLASTISRTRLRLELGPARLGNRQIFEGSVSAQYQVTPGWSLGGLYGANYWSAATDLATRSDPVLTHRGTVWAAHRFGATTLAPSATFVSQPLGIGGEVGLEGARQLSDVVTLTARTNGGYRSDGAMTLLFDSGLVLKWGRLMVGPGASVLRPYLSNWRVLPRLRTELVFERWGAVAWSTLDTEELAVAIGGQARLRWWSRGWFWAGYETFRGSVTIHTARFGLEIGL